ncbi:MAG: glycosyltransferase family 4 protein [Chitinophagaceae bacterium]|nr:glycosyltransferase family 4 protein [Chitinophagaceae bacterium]
MKVLWFTNTACGAAEKLRIPGLRGGWLRSLEAALVARKEIELSICFYSSQAIEPFRFRGTEYYPVHRSSSGSKTSRYLGRVMGEASQEKQELPKLLEIIGKVKPDIIHIHGTEENFGLVQQLTDIPAVISIQGILSPYVEKFYAGIPPSIVERYEEFTDKILLKSFRYSFQNLEKRAKRERAILKMSKNVIGRTIWDKRVTRVLSPDSIYFRNNELMRNPFYDIIWQKDEGRRKLKLITISSESLYKGFETIMKTASILVGYNKMEFEWVVVGLSDQDPIVTIVQNWLRESATELNIKLAGEKSETEIAQMLASSDIYCQVSHIENSPNSLCEAMLVGMPVIASNAGGTSSLLKDGREGILVQDGEPYSMAGAVIELAADTEKAVRYGVNAKETAMLRHDRKHVCSELIGIYLKIKDDNLKS